MLAVNGDWIDANFYIDSGADITLLPHSMGKLLGFEITNDRIQQLRGVGSGVVPVVIKKLYIKIGGMKINARVAWALIEDVPPLLGRLDIYNKFHVLFKEDERIIEFEKI